MTSETTHLVPTTSTNTGIVPVVIIFNEEKENESLMSSTFNKSKFQGYLTAIIGVTILVGVAFHYTNNNSDVVTSGASGGKGWDDHKLHMWEQSMLAQHGSSGTNMIVSADNLQGGKHDVSHELIYFNHSEAFDMLTSSKNHIIPDFFYYTNGWDAQITQSLCTVASSAALLNSLRGHITLPQDDTYKPYPWATQHELVMNPCARQFIPYWGPNYPTVPAGLGLELIKRLLECQLSDQNYDISIYPVDPSTWTVSDVRETIKDALYDNKARVIINYDRGGIGQGAMGHGHFSPIGAYNEEMDSFLVMDVAKYKYPPVWAPASNVFNAVGTVDNCGIFQYPQTPLDFSQSFEEIGRLMNCKQNYRGIVVVRPSTT